MLCGLLGRRCSRRGGLPIVDEMNGGWSSLSSVQRDVLFLKGTRLIDDLSRTHSYGGHLTATVLQ